jgi:hypothetical protein
MQWYDPLNNFMLLKRVSYPVPSPLNVFELLTEQNKIYPPVIIGIAAWYLLVKFNRESVLILNQLNLK